MKDSSENVARIRGRPRAADDRQVVQLILDATEQLLRDTSHFMLSERKIALEAGVNVSMIHYYFDNKDGLVSALIERYYDEVFERLKALDDVDPDSKTVVRDIFQILHDAYFHKPWVMRIMMSEFSRGNSYVIKMHLHRFGAEGLGMARLKRVFCRLADHGVCSRHASPEDIALGLCAMVTAPYLLVKVSGKGSFELDCAKKNAWGDFVADLFDRQLRATD